MTTGTLVRTVGYGGTGGLGSPNSGRSSFTLSDGTRLVVMCDPNQPGVTGDGGDGTGVAKFYIYTCPANAQSPWTLRATITPTAAVLQNRATWCAAIGANNNVHVAWRTSTGALAYRRVTYAAGNVYTVQAEETVLSAPPANADAGYIRRLDMDICGSSDNAVIVGYCALTASATLSNRRCELRVWTRTSTPAWVTGPTTIFIVAGSWYYLGSENVSCAADKAGPDGSNNITVMAAVTRKRNDGADLGGMLFRIATNTGTGTATVTMITPTAATSFGFAYGNSSGQIESFLFSSGNAEWTMILGLAWNPPKVGVWRFTMSGNTKTDLIALQSFTWPTSALQHLDVFQWMGVTFGNDTAVCTGLGTNGLIYAVALQFFRTPNHRVRYGVWQRWMENETYGGYGGYATHGIGGNRNLNLNNHGILWYGKPNSWKVLYKAAELPAAPAYVKPAASATIITDRPQVAAEHRWTGTNLPQTRTKMQWQIATDAGFSTNLRDFTESDTDFVLAVNTASPTNARVATTEALDTLSELFQGTWYIRARGITELGDAGAWSAAQAFVISHPPAASNLFPTNDAIFSYGVSGNITFSWKFTDPSPYDLQTAYQIIVEDAITEAIVMDTGKITSALQTGTHTIPVSGKDIQLRWKIRLWDSDDVQGPDSSYSTFYTVDVPAITINYPTAATSNILSTDDSTFEGSIGNWVSAWNTGAPVRDTTQFRSGVASLKFTATAIGSAAVGTTPTAYRCYPGQEIFQSAWVKAAATPRSAQMVFQFYDNTGTYLGATFDQYGSSVTDSTSIWTQIPQKTVFAPANAAYYRVAVQRQNMAAAESAFLDDVASGDTGNISSGAPIVNWTTSIGGGRTQTHYRVVIFAAGVIVYDSGWIFSTNNQHQIPLGYMVNNTSYTFRVMVKDNLGLENYTEQTVLTSFAVPVAPAVTVSTADYSTLGYVRLTWPNTADDPSFISYRIYRRITGVASWTLLAEITDQSTSYMYDDYLASSSVNYQYAVVQVVDRYGSTVESNYNILSVTPVSENYWLIHPSDNSKSIVLRSVIQDDPEEEYEQESYTIIGRGRHVDYGDRLGWHGSLTAQLRDRNGVSARTQKLQILELKAELTDVYLRTPFGDTYRVAIGNVKIGRIAGVGTNEYCNIEIPYEEVAI